MRYTKKPVTIEAVQFREIVDGMMLFETPEGMPDWLAEALCAPEGEVGSVFISYSPVGPVLHVVTLEGLHRASPGDWIIRGVKGELYPCKPDIFDATYRPATQTDIDIEKLRKGITELAEDAGCGGGSELAIVDALAAALDKKPDPAVVYAPTANDPDGKRWRLRPVDNRGVFQGDGLQPGNVLILARDEDRGWFGLFEYPANMLDRREVEITKPPIMVLQPHDDDAQVHPVISEATEQDFDAALASLINRYSLEGGSDTPDFILGEFLSSCLLNWNTAIRRREEWYAEECAVPAMQEPIVGAKHVINNLDYPELSGVHVTVIRSSQSAVDVLTPDGDIHQIPLAVFQASALHVDGEEVPPRSFVLDPEAD